MIDKKAESSRRALAMIAGWPGMGNVGLGAVEYLRRQLKATVCAELEIAAHLFPDSIEVKEGIGRILAPEPQPIYASSEPPVLLFEGSVQLGGEAGMRLAGELLDFARSQGVKTVYTGAAFAAPMSFRDESRVFGVATDDRVRDGFAALGVQPLSEGRIAGLNGLVLGLAADRGLAGACLLATMPHYAVQTQNPKASRALVRVFERIFNTTVDMAEIDRDVERLDQLLGEFESRVHSALADLRVRATQEPEPNQDREPESEDAETAILEPRKVMESIEELFEEVARDRSLAPRLKDELDRWGLFSLYEDRFLDLFDHSRPDGD